LLLEIAAIGRWGRFLPSASAGTVIANPSFQARWGMGVEEVVARMKEMMEMVIRAATGVGIPTIGRYTNHFSCSVFLEAKGVLCYMPKNL